jgi:tryptophan halogenase
MNSPDPIRSILIVGGGTAGWMAALYLTRFLHYGPCRITLVESANLDTIGVGETSNPRLLAFLRNLRLDEAAFIRACNATYNLGTCLTGWQGPGHEYWHPFGVCGGTIDGLDLFHPWLRAHRQGIAAAAYTDYSLQVQAARALKAPCPLTGTSPIMETGSYAFHLDAAALATHLRRIAIAEGVVSLFDEVEAVDLDAAGAIARLRTQSGRELTADLYLDCTGISSQLIEGALGAPWRDASDLLPCDRMVFTPLPRSPEPPPYTLVRAADAGWHWQFPLSHRDGAGYVYSSRHLDDEGAAAELLAAIPPPRRLGAVPRFLRTRVGWRSAPWTRNCVAIGPAAGYLEPLGPPGIHLIQIAIEALLERFPDRHFDPVLVRDYNAILEQVFTEARDFILLHYLLATREDTPFWREVRAATVPDSLGEAMERYAAIGLVWTPGSPFPPASYHFIYAGNDRLPRRPSPHVSRIDPAEAQAIMDQILKRNQALVATLPTHRALLQSIHEWTW